MSLYLDTSVVVPLFVEEGASLVTQRWIEDRAEDVFIADLVVTEFHSVMSRLVRMGILSHDRAETNRTNFDLWRDVVAQPLENLPIDIRVAGTFVRVPQPKLLTADATHLATCRRLDLTLATYDIDLQSIATRESVRWTCPT